jgi:hypothetical protein
MWCRVCEMKLAGLLMGKGFSIILCWVAFTLMA